MAITGATLILPISGPYEGVWSIDGVPGIAMGILNDDGYELSCTLQGQEINESDAYGMTLIEGIYRGQNWRIRLRGLEWDKPGLMSLLQMFGRVNETSPFTSFNPILTAIGDRWSNFCDTLLLTAVLSDPPSYPSTLTALGAGVAPNSQSSFMFTSKMREMPLELVLLPYTEQVSAGTFVIPFSTT